MGSLGAIPRALASLALIGGTTAAQIPDGSCVVSALGRPAHSAGGLFVLHPLGPREAVPIRGLGTDLTGAFMATPMGANCVARSALDDALLVGEFASAGSQIDLHVLHLDDLAVASATTIAVGRVTATSLFCGGIDGVLELPSGDIVVAVHGLESRGPLGGAIVGKVTRTGVVTPLPVPGPPDAIANALAFDPRSDTLYVAVLPADASATVLVALSMGSGTTRTLAHLGLTTGLAVEADGTLLANDGDQLKAIDPVTGTVTVRRFLAPWPNALAIEPATDATLVVLNGLDVIAGVYRLARSGAIAPLTVTVPGIPSGIAVSPNPRTYGRASPLGSAYRWKVAPAPGGLPYAGNLAFALEVVTDGGAPAPGFVWASALGTERPLGALQLLLDPAALVPVGPVGASGRLPLPIPGHVPAGTRLHLQSFHLDPTAPGGLAASDGQRVTVLR